MALIADIVLESMICNLMVDKDLLFLFVEEFQRRKLVIMNVNVLQKAQDNLQL